MKVHAGSSKSGVNSYNTAEFLAILEISGFRELLSTIGYRTASALMEAAEYRLGAAIGVTDFALTGLGVIDDDEVVID